MILPAVVLALFAASICAVRRPAAGWLFAAGAFLSAFCDPAVLANWVARH